MSEIIRWTVATRESGTGLVGPYAYYFTFALGSGDVSVSFDSAASVILAAEKSVQSHLEVSVVQSAQLEYSLDIDVDAPSNLNVSYVNGAMNLSWVSNADEFIVQREQWTGVGEPV